MSDFVPLSVRYGGRRKRLAWRVKGWRETVALRLAPWLYVPYREEREEAFRDLAEVAYLSRDAVWTSPRVLVETALREATREATRKSPVSERDCHGTGPS